MTEDAVNDRSSTQGWEAGAFENLFESAPDAAIVVDANGRIVLANASAQELFGYSRNELLGQTVELLVPERYRDRHVEQRQAYMDQPRKRPMGHPGLDLRGRRKDGSEFPAEIALGPMTTDRGQFVTAIIRDVTVHRGTSDEERIRVRVAEYAELLRSSFTHVDPER